MKTSSIALIALPFTLLAACGSGPDGIEAKEDQSSAVVGDYTWDTNRLTPIPAGTIPSVRLQPSAFAGNAVRTQLVQTTEATTMNDQGAGRFDYQSPSWRFSVQPTRGMVLAVNQGPPGPSTNPSESALQSAALARLQSWGIRGGEIGPVWQRRLMTTSEENGEVGAPSAAGYKTFVLRSILGVRVSGHRAVVTHGLDGSFRRVIADWPPLAPSGHLLHTALTTAQIKARAASHLAAEGFTSGPIRLGWRYAAIPSATGEVRLELRATARTAGKVGNGMGEEPYEIDVDVSAVP